MKWQPANLKVNQHLPQHDPSNLDARKMRIGIVVAEWNSEVTESLFNGARETLLKAGCPEANIIRKNVPGSFELPLAAKWMLDSIKPDAVICLGCVVQGETRHFDFICDQVASGIMQVQLQYSVPVIFGVLTTNDQQQAIDRAGGDHSNKGIESAVTAIRMVMLRSTNV